MTKTKKTLITKDDIKIGNLYIYTSFVTNKEHILFCVECDMKSHDNETMYSMLNYGEIIKMPEIFILTYCKLIE